MAHAILGPILYYIRAVSNQKAPPDPLLVHSDRAAPRSVSSMYLATSSWP